MRKLLAVSTLVLVACGTTTGDTSTTADSLPAPTSTSPPTTKAMESGVATTVAPPTTVPVPAGTFEIEVTGTEVVGGGRISVAVGDDVTILVSADVVDEAHLHGYDLYADIGPGETGTIRFVASIPGVFELELESSGLLLAEVEVS